MSDGKLRVGAFAHFWVPHVNAGSEVMIHHMMRELSRAGHEVTIFATDHGEENRGTYELGGLTVNVVPPHEAVHELAAWKPDVVVTHHHRSPDARRAANMCRAKLVDILHNNHGLALSRMVRTRPDFVVVNSRWIPRSAARLFSKIPYVVIHPPVDAAKHSTAPGDRVTLVNMHPEKGSDVFYRLVAERPDTQFLAVEGGYHEQDLRPGDNVMVQAHTADMKRDVWSKTGVLLMPSVYESYGMAGVEALCSGIPVIAHPTPGLLESLGPAGIFVDRGDIEGWHQALDALADPKTYQAARRMALDRAAALNPAGEMAVWVGAIEALVR